MNRQERNTMIATGVWVVVSLGAAFEIAAFNTDWWNSISYYSYHNPFLRWFIAFLIVVAFVLWLWHSGHPIPKLVRRLVWRSIRPT